MRPTAPSKSAVRITTVALTVLVAVMIAGGAALAVEHSSDSTVGLAQQQPLETESAAPLDSAISSSIAGQSASDGAFFEVEIVETNDPVEFGESDIEVTARFENTGNREGSQLVSGSAAEGFDESILTLEPGESTEITYRFDYIESGEYTARIQSLNETETTVVRVVEPFDVEITDTNSPVEEGDTLAVTTDIRSTGDQEETQEIELEVDGIGTDSQDVTLEDGESTTETFRVDTESGDAGEYTATVASLTDSDSTTVRVTESDEEVVYWQVDFGEGEDPPMPPSYWPNDLVAALGNSEDGVTQNPSLRRQETDGQLGDVTIVDNEFEFDDDGEPTEVTVEFEIDEDGETRDLHLASFTLPGPFDEDEIDQQELFDDASGTYGGGDTGELTVSIPQADD